MCLNLEIKEGKTVYYQSVDGLSEKGTIVLDSIEGELGDVTVSGTLSFEDYTSGGELRLIATNRLDFEMRYRFAVTKVSADVSGSGSTVPVTVTFEAIMPDSYDVVITDSQSAVNQTVPVSEGYCSFDSISASEDDTLYVNVKNKEGQVWASYTYTISKTSAQENYTAPSMMHCTNPGDALVTYNDN